MNNNLSRKQICQSIGEISLFVETLIDARTYDDTICYLLGLLSDAEHILVAVGNMRFDSLLKEKQILLEEQIFDEWMALYIIAKAILTKRKYSKEHKKMIDEHAESMLTKLEEFEKTIQDHDV